jgi:hypothetical protein
MQIQPLWGAHNVVTFARLRTFAGRAGAGRSPNAVEVIDVLADGWGDAAVDDKNAVGALAPGHWQSVMMED